MGGQEDREKAEKLAAAKKRVAALKAKMKAATTGEEAVVQDKTSKTGTLKSPVKATPAAAVEDEPLGKGDTPPTEAPAGDDEALFNDAIKAATSAPPSNEESGDTSPIPSTLRPQTHARVPSLSIASKLRSSSFRLTSPTQTPSASTIPDPNLPPLSPSDPTTLPEIYRKQSVRLEELERDVKRLDKEVREYESRWRRSQNELDELREASSEADALKAQARKAEEAAAENARLRSEIELLRRQAQQRRSSSGKMAGSSPDAGEVAMREELARKDGTIADMELEMSRLRSELHNSTRGCEAHGEQISALQTSNATLQTQNKAAESELADLRKALARASEKAVRDGTDATSKDVKLRSLERDLADAVAARETATAKAAALEKKLDAMAKLHKETESRTAARLAATESQAREASMLKARLAAAGAEALRLREERKSARKARGDTLATDEDGLDALEDEATAKLQRRIRELESENFELRRGAWREKRRDLQPSVTDVDSDGREVVPSAVEEFDEVDLSGPGKPRTQPHSQQQKHSSFSTVINSGLAAFRAAASVSPVQQQGRPRQDSLLEEFDDDDGEGGGFDEAAFAAAHREEEARKMVEHVREVKRGLSEWKGWRLDLVDSRRALGGGGGGWGDVFEV